MYPTAAKLTAALVFAALAWVVSRLAVPNLPEGTSEGWMPEVNAVIGLLFGWRIAGRHAGSGWVAGGAIGLTTGAVLVFWALLIWAGREMVLRSLALRYDGIVEALEDMIALFLRLAEFLVPGLALPALATGSIAAGFLAEAVARRYP